MVYHEYGESSMILANIPMHNQKILEMSQK